MMEHRERFFSVMSTAEETGAIFTRHLRFEEAAVLNLLGLRDDGDRL
jgi:hypothetical protein